MTTFAANRNRVKARVVGIGKRGGKLTWVVPKRKKFVEINWFVLWDFLKIVVWILIVFGCGIVTGLIWGMGG